MTLKKYPMVILLLIKKWFAKYQRTEPSLMAKYKYGTYNKGYFSGGINIDLNFITRGDNIVIP